MILNLTKEEIEDILMNLDQCESEGYLNSGDAAYSGMKKLMNLLHWMNEMESEL